MQLHLPTQWQVLSVAYCYYCRRHWKQQMRRVQGCAQNPAPQICWRGACCLATGAAGCRHSQRLPLLLLLPVQAIAASLQKQMG